VIVFVAQRRRSAPLSAKGVGRRIAERRAARGFRLRPDLHSRGETQTAAQMPANCATNAAIAARLARFPRATRRAAMKSPPLALYAHFPVVRAEVPVLRLQFAHAARELARAALRRRAAARSRCAAADVESRRSPASFWRRNAQPVFAAAIGRLLDTRERSRFRPRIEITLEANPGTIERGSSPNIAPPA
jgi:hypothetical protein